jgi:deoxyribodipyrimidine photolyase-related protein
MVLGDQLNPASAAFDGFDDRRDAVLQIEADEEARYVPQHKQRLVLFFSAMRHFRDAARAVGRRVVYSALDDDENRGTLAAELIRIAAELEPEQIMVLEPGDWRVRAALAALDLPIEFRPDRDFLCDTRTFEEFAEGRRSLVLEDFYRMMRRRLGILIDRDGEPIGGAWNFDRENRKAFGRKGAPLIPPRLLPEPDRVTGEVMALVERRFPDAPGRMAALIHPVTRAHAQLVLDGFVRMMLPDFGHFQDAMLGGKPFLFHSLLSPALNLHLLSAREVVDAVLDSPADAPLNAVEGFVRQIIGWREFVRGIYWRHMPDYAAMNVLDAQLPMPRFYWTGETEMRCLADAIGHTIEHGYAHHIERLMVLGQFTLLLGVRPYDVHRWHLSMFVDAIDWVSLPNALGMSQHGDGGIVGTKPYVASGNYIARMSDHCRRCRYDPHKAVGDDACPFTTLYWDFLARHAQRFAGSQRMRYQYANLRRKDEKELNSQLSHRDFLIWS